MASVTRTATFFSGTDTATPSFTAQAIGANGGTDSIYIAVFNRNTTNPAHASTTLTVDGVSATLCASVAAWNGSSGCVGAIFSIARNSLPDPTQTDIDIAVTWAGVALRTGGCVWVSPNASATAGGTGTDSDANSSHGGNITQTPNLDTTASGVVVGAMWCGNGGTPDVTLTIDGLTADGAQITPGENIRWLSASHNNIQPRTARVITALFDHNGTNFADPVSLTVCFPATVGTPVYAPGLVTNGTRFQVATPYSGPTTVGMRIKVPAAPAAVSRKLVVILPVKPANDATFGDGFDEFVANGWDDDFNFVLVAPETPATFEPWVADDLTDTYMQYETFLTELIPWLLANVGALSGVTQTWLFSFSKGGLGSLVMMLKHPDVVQRIACFDAPITNAQVPDGSQPITATTFGSETNYDDNYDVLTYLADWIGNGDYTFNRMWISGWATATNYDEDMDTLHWELSNLSVSHDYDNSGSSDHSWDGGGNLGDPEYWLEPAVEGLVASFNEEQSPVVTPPIATLTLTTFAPTIHTPRLCTPPTRALTLTAFAPTVIAPRLATPPTKSLTLTTFAPVVSVAAAGGGAGAVYYYRHALGA